MTRQLRLKPVEYRKFWPCYFSYRTEIRSTERIYPEDEIALEEKTLAIRKRYARVFQDLLGSSHRASEVFLSEKRFNLYIRNELEKRKGLHYY